MIYGVGVDLLKISRLENSISSEDPFVKKTFTNREMEEACDSKDRLHYYSSRFACKEAVFKCLKIDANTIRLNEIEVLNSSVGVPFVQLSNNLKKIVDKKGIVSIEISLSYEDEYTMAYAIAQTIY